MNIFRKLLMLFMLLVPFSVIAEADLQQLISSADNGNEENQYNLGHLYLEGDQVAKDEGKAFSYIKKAAEAGIIPAEYETAIFYGQGKIVPKNEQLAKEWIKKAADQGHPMSLYILGQFLLQESYKENKVQGLALWMVAAENEENLVSERDGLKGTLNSSEIKIAIMLATSLKRCESVLQLLDDYKKGKLDLAASAQVYKTKEQLVESMFKNLQMDTLWNKGLGVAKAKFFKNGRETEEYFANYMYYEKIKPDLVKMYTDTYSFSQLAAFNDFLGSKNGSAYIRPMLRYTLENSFGSDSGSFAEELGAYMDANTTRAEKERFRLFAQSKEWQEMKKNSGLFNQKFSDMLIGGDKDRAAKFKEIIRDDV